MDNLCHTLAGAAFAEAGLKRTTRYGSAALMIAANLPDVDVLAFLAETPSVALRRGWTHGILAQAILPVLLTGIFVAIDRFRPPGRSAARPLRAPALLLLSYIGVLSHVGLDLLNSYGIRLLMPFSGRWFYGDALFIIDPWLWVTLAAGVATGRVRRRAAPAAISLLVASLYILGMVGIAAAARQLVLSEWQGMNGRTPSRLMVGPVPINPLRKTVIVDAGSYYERGSLTLLPRSLDLQPARIPKGSEHPAAKEARDEPDFRALLTWSRFPRYDIVPVEGGLRVTLRDMRFDRGLFSVTTVVPSSGALPPGTERPRP